MQTQAEVPPRVGEHRQRAQRPGTDGFAGEEANTGGDANAGGQFSQGGQAGAGSDVPVPSDLLLYKLVEPGNSFEVVGATNPFPTCRYKATELGADGYVTTTARWNIVTGDSDMRYVAVKPEGSTTSYDVLVGHEPFLTCRPATELGADGYVITTARWNIVTGDSDMRYIAVKPEGSTTSYDVPGYEPLPDMQE